MRFKAAMLCVWALVGASASAAPRVDLEAMLKRAQFDGVEISPDGQYLAATVPQESSQGVVVMRRSDGAITTAFTLGKDEYIHAFFWANDKRLLIRVDERIGALERPQETGELYGLDFDQKTPDVLVGWETQGAQLGTMIGSKKERVGALSVHKIAGDDHHVIITAYPYRDSLRFNTAELLDVDTGRRTELARAPIEFAMFYPDNAGVVRFATGSKKEDNFDKLWYRPSNTAEWKLINDAATTGLGEWPRGFSADNRIAYLEVEKAHGPNAIVAYDTVTGERKEVMRDAVSNPGRILTAFDGKDVPVGTMYADGIPHPAFFDPQSREAKLYALLGQAFAGSAVEVASTTRDGKLILVFVHSDRDPGRYFLFDANTHQAQPLLSLKRWIDPKAMAPMQAVQIKARDGLPLRAYLTLPPGRDGKNLPLVVYPHGGPFNIYDVWGYDNDVQILAAAGYAVLQVNYRGSGNYGQEFVNLGRQQWGGTMQDDLTDATQWAVAQGIADRSRMCMYGSSYGAYASLAGVAKEPTLYKCAVGYVGVYDLPKLTADAAEKGTSLVTDRKDWVGTDPDKLAKASPYLHADQIKVPVFLAAGGEDTTAPIEHTEKMAAALKKACVPVETLYFSTEGHGFYTLDHQRQFYTRLLDFLDRNIGQNAKVADAH